MSGVAVVGGGLAGLTAALACAEAGREVTLLESSPRLGGRAGSFARGDLVLDTGQHVFLRCCTRYRALLDRLGVGELVTLQRRLDVSVLEPGGRAFRLRRDDLPAPLHLARTLLSYGALNRRQRLQVVRAAQALRAIDPDAAVNEERTFGSWLDAHGQDQRCLAAVWDLVGIATLNAPAAEASLALAATVFQLGLLGARDAGDIGWSTVPLEQLHALPAAAALAARGALVHRASRVTAVQQHAEGWQVLLRDGHQLRVDEVVLAVPPRMAEQLLPPGAVALPPQWADGLGSSPIVNVHVVYDRQVLDLPFVAGLGTAVQWIFDRTSQVGLREGQCVAVSLSAADAFVDLPLHELRDVVLPALVSLLPLAAQAQVLDVFVTRDRAATFRARPGTRALRPPSRTAQPGLVLAGAWTDTGWPATMEGAVRSGEAAAAAVLERGRSTQEVAA